MELGACRQRLGKGKGSVEEGGATEGKGEMGIVVLHIRYTKSYYI